MIFCKYIYIMYKTPRPEHPNQDASKCLFLQPGQCKQRGPIGVQLIKLKVDRGYCSRCFSYNHYPSAFFFFLLLLLILEVASAAQRLPTEQRRLLKNKKRKKLLYWPSASTGTRDRTENVVMVLTRTQIESFNHEHECPIHFYSMQ